MSSLWGNLKNTINEARNKSKDWATTAAENSIKTYVNNAAIAKYEFKKALLNTSGSSQNPYGMVPCPIENGKKLAVSLGVFSIEWHYVQIKSEGITEMEWALAKAYESLCGVLDALWSSELSKTDIRKLSTADGTMEVKYSKGTERSSIEINTSLNSAHAVSLVSKDAYIRDIVESKKWGIGLSITYTGSKKITYIITLNKNNKNYFDSKLQQAKQVELNALNKQIQEAAECSLIDPELKKELKTLGEKSYETEGGVFLVDFNNMKYWQKPKPERKEEKLETAATIPVNTARKPVTRISVESLPPSSVFRPSLSRDDLEKGGNNQEPHHDKRPKNTKNSDVYGLESKVNSPGCIKLYEANSTGGYKEPFTIDCFLIQSVQTSLKEKFSIFQSLSGDILAYFFGKQPVLYRFSAALYNTYNQDWYNDFKHFYENNLRGSASISKNMRTIISYEKHVIEGFFLEMNMQESATNTNVINIDFTILFIQEHILDYNPPDLSSTDTSAESTSSTTQIQDSRLLLTPDGYTITKPTGITSVTARKNTRIRSTVNDYADDKLKTVSAGASLTIIDEPIKGKDGEIWYLLHGGKYSDGSPISKHNSYIRERDLNWGITTEETLSDKKVFDPKQPAATVIKSKKDVDAKSLAYEQNNNIVEKAKDQSKNKLLEKGS